MNIVFLGSGEFGIECLKALKESCHDLCLTVTQPPRAAGRGRKPAPTAIAKWAKVNSVECLEADDVNSRVVFEKISECAPDLILVIACGQKIGKELTALAPKGAINVHASLLPKLRGAAPINRAIINGERQTGVSIITLAEKMDAGQVLSQTETDIAPNETAGQLHDRLAQIAAPLLLDTIGSIEAGTAIYTEQDHAKATLAPKLKKSDGFLDFNEPADLLERKIRGFWPWPGAAADYLSKQTGKTVRITLALTEVTKQINDSNVVPGTFDSNLNVVCGQDALIIKKIKPAGSPLMDFADFVNGRHTKPGDMFIQIR